MVFRAAFFIDRIIFETAQLQNLGGQIQIGSYILCFVGITANGNHLAAQFVIAAENIGTGMRLSETIAEASGIQFQALATVNQQFQNRIDGILIFIVGVIFVLGRRHTDDIIQVP